MEKTYCNDTGYEVKAVKWLRRVTNSYPNLFYHWELGYKMVWSFSGHIDCIIRAVWIERFTHSLPRTWCGGSVRGLGVKIPFTYTTRFSCIFLRPVSTFMLVRSSYAVGAAILFGRFWFEGWLVWPDNVYGWWEAFIIWVCSRKIWRR